MISIVVADFPYTHFSSLSCVCSVRSIPEIKVCFPPKGAHFSTCMMSQMTFITLKFGRELGISGRQLGNRSLYAICLVFVIDSMMAKRHFNSLFDATTIRTEVIC